MTTGKSILDGFGVHEDLSGIATHYGAHPVPRTGGGDRFDPYVPIPPAAPDFQPKFVINQKPAKEVFMLTVTGKDGQVLALAMTEEEWGKIRAAILEALR